MAATYARRHDKRGKLAKRSKSDAGLPSAPACAVSGFGRAVAWRGDSIARLQRDPHLLTISRDRLPWVSAGGTSDIGSDNFSPLTSLDWQVHVYGAAAASLSEVCARRGLALHTFPWQSATSRTGLVRGAVYLVRPDGYVGLADLEASPARVERYLDSRCCPGASAGDGGSAGAH